jgi:hypothetical protein
MLNQQERNSVRRICDLMVIRDKGDTTKATEYMLELETERQRNLIDG